MKLPTGLLLLCRMTISVFVCFTPVWAQFQGLATTSDGSTLYFATSLVQKGTDQPAYGKLFRIDADGLALQDMLPFIPLQPPSGEGTAVGSPYNLQSASVSSDGQWLAVTAWADCYAPYVNCSKQDLGIRTTTAGPDGSRRNYSGTLTLSANGAWAFGSSGLNFGNVAVQFVDVATGESTIYHIANALTILVSETGRSISNDGTAVFGDSYRGEIVLLKGSDIRRLPFPSPYWVVIDGAARTIVAAAYPYGQMQAIDVATGAATPLASDGYAQVVSDDGQTVVYLSGRTGTPQVWTMKIDGTGDTQLTNHPLGIASLILSGDGSTAYAVTLGRQLIKLGVQSSDIQELIPHTPYLNHAAITTAPGNLTTLSAFGFVEARMDAGPPLPYSLGGVSVTVQGIPAVMVNVQPDSMIFVTPPNVAADPAVPVAVQAHVESESPFTDTTDVPATVQPFLPLFLDLGGPSFFTLAWHEDWSSPVNSAFPARPGELVHLNATGLGPTAPAVEYGMPAPSDEPLARLLKPMVCGDSTFSTAGSAISSGPVTTGYQGLEPGLSGVYQVDVQVPQDLGTGVLYLRCTIGTSAKTAVSVNGGWIPVAGQ